MLCSEGTALRYTHWTKSHRTCACGDSAGIAALGEAVSKGRLDCPSCGACLVSESSGASLSCKHCVWRLITLEAWRKMTPFQQGYTLYMQGSWPTSEIENEKNPYVEGSSAWTEFKQGGERAMLHAQDSEE